MIATAAYQTGRTIISMEELIQFRWPADYDGSPSTMGLRQFNEDGTWYILESVYGHE